MTDGHPKSGAPDSHLPADWDTLARHLAGESTPEEAVRIQALLADYPENRDLLEALDHAISRLPAGTTSEIDVEGALRRVKARAATESTPPLQLHAERRSSAPPARRPQWRTRFPAIAAAAILVISLGTWVSIESGTAPDAITPAPRMLVTGVGVRDSMRLPDGSDVVLGPLSSIIVGQGYGEGTRDIEVRGEAWFDVVHDVRRPFTVRAGAATILDVGTIFSVRSDVSEGVAVTVTEGSVSLRAANASIEQGVVLRAGDNGVLKPGGQVVSRPATEDDLAWLRGRLVFREAPMNEVVASMRRWYGIQLRVSDPSLLDKHITATFTGEPPERVLEVLRLVLGADIERRGDTAIVRPAPGSVRSR